MIIGLRSWSVVEIDGRAPGRKKEEILPRERILWMIEMWPVPFGRTTNQISA
jgi:hypothetical protein